MTDDEAAWWIQRIQRIRRTDSPKRGLLEAKAINEKLLKLAMKGPGAKSHIMTAIRETMDELKAKV